MAGLPLDGIVTDETQRPPSRGLIESLAAEGLLRPLDVRLRDDGTYELVDGSRRLAGAKTLGWTTIDAIVEPAGGDRRARGPEGPPLNPPPPKLPRRHPARHPRPPPPP